MSEKTNTPATGDGLIKLPVRYDVGGGYFWDANDSMIAQVRGWGELTGTGGRRLSDNEAANVQDARGEYIATCINEHETLTATLRKKDEELAILRRAVESYQRLEASTIEVLTNRGLIERIGEQWRWYNYHDEVFNSLTEMIEEKTK